MFEVTLDRQRVGAARNLPVIAGPWWLLPAFAGSSAPRVIPLSISLTNCSQPTSHEQKKKKKDQNASLH